MSELENRLRSAFERRAEDPEVNLDTIWRDIAGQLPSKHRSRFHGTLAVAAATVLVIGAGAALYLRDGSPPPVSPSASTKASTKPSAKAPAKTKRNSPAPRPAWQYQFDVPANELPAVRKHFTPSYGTPAKMVPVDILETPNGQHYALVAYQQRSDNRARMIKKFGRKVGSRFKDSDVLGFAVYALPPILPTTKVLGGGMAGDAELPLPEGSGTASDRYLTDAHILDYPQGGDGKVQPSGWQMASGTASKEVTKVVGTDSLGRRHVGKVAGGADWINHLYYLAVPKGTKVVKVEAYSKDGRLLSTKHVY